VFRVVFIRIFGKRKNKTIMKKVFNVGVTLFFSCMLLLFVGMCMDDGSVQLDSSYNWIGSLWTIVFLFSVVLVLVGAVPKDKK
jgi:hypothetical protein